MSCGSTCSQTHSPILHHGRHSGDAPWHASSPFRWLVGLQARWRAREELRELSDAQLRDVGLTREQIEHAARRPFI